MYHRHKGFALFEILLAFTMLSLLYVPVVGVLNLIRMKDNPLIYTQFDDVIYKGITGVVSTYVTNGDTALCPDISQNTVIHSYSSVDLHIGTSSEIHSIKSIGGNILLGIDSPNVSDTDVAMFSPHDMKIVSQLQMSPGVTDMSMSGTRVYTAQSGVSSDMSIIDLYPQMTLKRNCSIKVDRRDGKKATAIQAVGDVIVVGFEKNNGPELFLVDSDCHTLDSIEYGFGVHDIYAINGVVYVLGPSNPEILSYTIESNTFIPAVSLDVYGDSGNARSLDYTHTGFVFGRSRGNDEYVFLSPVLSVVDSVKIGSSVDVLISGIHSNILLTSHADKELQVFKGNQMYTSINLPTRANGATCIDSVLYIGTSATTSSLITIENI